MNLISAKAYAKLNLAIDVYNRLENGYHNIDMITVPLFLHDTLEINKIGDTTNTYLFCDDERVPCDESNLVHKAFTILKQEYNFKTNFKVYIYKRIPLQAGLGGGSSDAASMLKALPTMLKDLNITEEILMNLAPKIGSDVPFFVKCKPARVKNIGDVLNPITIKCPYYVLLVKPLQGLSTKKIYDLYDEMKDSVTHPDLDTLVHALEIDDEEMIQANLINVLSYPAIKELPLISDILNSFEMMDLSLHGMSGTGSTCFALSKDKEYLKKVSDVFLKQGHQVFVTQFNLKND